MDFHVAVSLESVDLKSGCVGLNTTLWLTSELDAGGSINAQPVLSLYGAQWSGRRKGLPVLLIGPFAQGHVSMGDLFQLATFTRPMSSQLQTCARTCTHTRIGEYPRTHWRRHERTDTHAWTWTHTDTGMDINTDTHMDNERTDADTLTWKHRLTHRQPYTDTDEGRTHTHIQDIPDRGISRAAKYERILSVASLAHNKDFINQMLIK